jgi:hypothetical protein
MNASSAATIDCSSTKSKGRHQTSLIRNINRLFDTILQHLSTVEIATKNTHKLTKRLRKTIRESDESKRAIEDVNHRDRRELV